VFENRMLRRILGLNRDDVTRGWRKLQDEGLHNFYFSADGKEPLSGTLHVFAPSSWKAFYSCGYELSGSTRGKKYV
jgi:hypothetical protein